MRPEGASCVNEIYGRGPFAHKPWNPGFRATICVRTQRSGPTHARACSPDCSPVHTTAIVGATVYGARGIVAHHVPPTKSLRDSLREFDYVYGSYSQSIDSFALKRSQA